MIFSLAIAATAGAVVYSIAINTSAQPADVRAARTVGTVKKRMMTCVCANIRTAWQSIGEVNYNRKSSEQGNIKFRRSLYFVSKLKKGDVINKDDIRSIRPGYGLRPSHFDAIIGCKTSRNVNYGDPVKFDDITNYIGEK